MKRILFMLVACLTMLTAGQVKATPLVDLVKETVITKNLTFENAAASWFIVATEATRRTPVVGSFITLWGYPGLPCYEWYSTGSDPGNPIWWNGRTVKVISVGYSCDGVPNGAMYVQYLGSAPYTGAGVVWPTAGY